MKGKRGEVSGTFILILIGVFILVMVVLFYNDFFGIGRDIVDQISSAKVTEFSQACSSLISIGAGYCTERLIIGDDTYVNCPYAIKNFGISVGELVPPNCNEPDNSKSICNLIKEEMGENYNPDEIKVNGKMCKDWGVVVTCAGLGSSWGDVECGANTHDDKTTEAKYDPARGNLKFCCVAKSGVDINASM